MAEKQIDFWFTMGSTYTYLTAMRLPEIARTTNTNFRWRPFHLLILLKEMNHIPFADNLPNALTCGGTLKGVRHIMASLRACRRLTPSQIPSERILSPSLGCARDGALITFVPLIASGFSPGRRTARMKTLRRVYERLVRTWNECLQRRKATRLKLR